MQRKIYLNGRLRQWVLVEVTDRAENAYKGFTHFAWNLSGNQDVEFEGMSGFKWDKLWEGIESSRDMQDSEEYTLIYTARLKNKSIKNIIMKKILLLFTLIFTITTSAQYTILKCC